MGFPTQHVNTYEQTFKNKNFKHVQELQEQD